jgi:septum formation protein
LLYLASKSPRRRELLMALGVDFETLDVDIPEIWDGIESAREYVSRLATEKARAAKAIAERDLPILASDTEVLLGNRVLGKPANIDDAISMLMSLSDCSHEVYSAVALLWKTEKVLVNISRIKFKELTELECREYCELESPYDKAGAYGIQGRAAAFICKLEGSYSGVMGLPLTETATLLKAM